MADTGADKGKLQKLDMNAVWSRGMALMRENRQLLGILAGVFVLLPSALVALAIPPQGVLDEPMQVILDPNSGEEAMELAAQAITQAMIPVFIWAGLAQIIQHIGYGAMMALIGPNRPTVGRAIVEGLKAILPVVIAFVVYFAGINVVLLLLQLVLTPLGTAVAAFLGGMLGLLVVLFVTARLSLTLPAIVIDGEMNPIKALLRSWKLTARSKGNIFGFWMLLIVAYFVIFILVSAVAGLLAAIAGQGAGATLINGLIGGIYGAITGVVICAVAVAMHAQLAGPKPTDLASQFE